MADDKTQFLTSLFEQIESQVQFGDNKASLLVAGDAILLAVCGGLIQTVSGCQQKPFSVNCMCPSVPLGLAGIAAALLITSLGCALWAARPAGIHKRPRNEFFLLSHIARTKRAAFVESYKESSYQNLVEEALIAIHGKAEYAATKFRWLRRAINATLLSLGFIVITSLVAVASRALGS